MFLSLNVSARKEERESEEGGYIKTMAPKVWVVELSWPDIELELQKNNNLNNDGSGPKAAVGAGSPALKSESYFASKSTDLIILQMDDTGANEYKDFVTQKEEVKENIFRDKNKRKLAPYNVLLYKDKPRLGTALELLKATQEIEQRLEEVSLPLLIMHGESDIITDPSASKALYDKARVEDKKLCLYKNAYHDLLEGEPDETISSVLHDMISWLDKHSSRQNTH
ncbi:hypothetical protein K1719_011387 [Acacia pycnantha]|nr:hypothetical protein K1719_011387 [Acacia pycnantha]